jgi:hypothetical protein
MSKNYYSIDFHHINLKGNDPKELIYKKLDSFLNPILRKTNITVEIIVGRGNNSSIYTFINGIPTLRYYTLQYLSLIGIEAKYNYISGKISFYL